MLRIAICDDQQTDLTTICGHLKKYQELHPEYDFYIDTFCSSQELLRGHGAGQEYDIYFLDILMPEGNGIDLARQLRDRHVAGLIIFLTSSPEYSLEAFSVKAMQYLIKPVKESDIFTVMDDAASVTSKMAARSILASLTDGKRKLLLSTITYVECRSRVLYYHLSSGEVLRSKTIRQPFETEMHILLEDYRFCRTHQSFIINMYYASRLLTNEIVMQDSSSIPISKKRLKDVRKEYLDFLSRQIPEL